MQSFLNDVGGLILIGAFGAILGSGVGWGVSYGLGKLFNIDKSWRPRVTSQIGYFKEFGVTFGAGVGAGIGMGIYMGHNL